MSNNKALRGLGQGLAQVGEMLLADSLAKAREAALMKLRAEYDAPEREERKRQFEVEKGQRDRQISLAEQEAKDQAAYRKKSLELEGRKVDAVASSKEAGKWQPIYEEQVVTDENGNSKTVKKQVGTFNELTNEHRYYMPDDASDVIGDLIKDAASGEPKNYVEARRPTTPPAVAVTQARPTQSTPLERSGQEFRQGVTDPLFAAAQPVVEGLLDTPQNRRPPPPSGGRFY